MSVYEAKPLDLSRLPTIDLEERPSIVSAPSFARPLVGSCAAFLDTLPDTLGAKELRALAAAIVAANRSKKKVIFGLGAHVIKTGLAPIVIQLIQDGRVDGIAMNGAGIVHDYEIGLLGATSEDVDSALPQGRFGVARQTAEALNAAAVQGAAEGIGMGEAVSRLAAGLTTPTAHLSLLAACYRARVPVTVHVALGTDILHMHPSADGAAIGATSLRDFRLLAALVAGLDGGGVYVNIGSAVILPEVFLKAVAVVRGLGMPLEGLTTANLDFIQHYRPLTNVVRRPTAGHGRGITLTGHHEILLPLLAASIRREEERLGPALASGETRG